MPILLQRPCIAGRVVTGLVEEVGMEKPHAVPVK
jgi:hypothetical protein